MLDCAKYIWRKVSPKFIQNYRGELARRKKIMRNIETGVVFLHIPKAAGSSIGEMIYGHDKPGHFPLSEYRAILKEDFQNVFFFTFTREPIDRFKSAYNYLLNKPKNENDVKFGVEVLGKYSDINHFILEYLNEDTIYSHIHFYPQTHFIQNEGIVDVDFIGKFENIGEDVDELSKILGVKNTLGKHNSRNSGDIHISEESKKKLIRLYQKDYMELGYEY